MTILACRDCGKPVSAEAVTCPNCGRPTKVQRRYDLIMLAILAIFIFFFWASTWQVH